jgi:hypothetical protein
MAIANVNSAQASSPSRPDPWRIAWNVIAGDVWQTCLLLALALVLALIAWLPQSPDSATDPVAFSRWRSEAQTRLGNSFVALQDAGLFSLEQSAVLRGLIGLMALGLMVRTLDSAAAMWRSRHFELPPAHVPAEASIQSSLEDVIGALRRRRLRILRDGEAVRADHFPMAHIGQLAIYLGALVILAGLIVTSLYGWQSNRLTLGVGQMGQLNPPPTSYGLRLDALDGNEQAQIALLKETETAATGVLGPNHPLEMGGLMISFGGSGPAIRASATLTDGQGVRLQSSASATPSNDLLLLLTQDEPERFFAAPDAGLVVRLSRAADASNVLRAQVYRSRTGTLLFDDQLPLDGHVSIENVNLALTRETFAVLMAQRDPGRLVSLTGIGLLALGLMLAALWPVERVWCAAAPNGTLLAGDAALVQSIAAAPTRRERIGHFIAAWLWRLGLAALSIIAGVPVVFRLTQGMPIWPAGSMVTALMAAWLVGGACALLTRRTICIATIGMALALLTTLAIQSNFVLRL